MNKTTITLMIEDLKSYFDCGSITREQAKEQVQGMIKFIKIAVMSSPVTEENKDGKLSKFAVSEFRRIFN